MDCPLEDSAGLTQRARLVLGTPCVPVDGLEEMYRGEAGVVSALLNKFPTVLAERTCGAHGVFRGTEDVPGFLAHHSIDLLPISEKLKSEMHRFGLHTMGAWPP